MMLGQKLAARHGRWCRAHEHAHYEWYQCNANAVGTAHPRMAAARGLVRRCEVPSPHPLNKEIKTPGAAQLLLRDVAARACTHMLMHPAPPPALEQDLRAGKARPRPARVCIL